MPRIDKILTLDISPVQFLNSCTPDELKELQLLLYSPRYQQMINPPDQIE